MKFIVEDSSCHLSCFVLCSSENLGSNSAFTGMPRIFDSTPALVPFRKKQKSSLVAPKNKMFGKNVFDMFWS